MNTDVFDYYRESEDLPDMIILNYMLSDMLKMNVDGFNGFLEELYNLFMRMPSGVLLINDINIGLKPDNVRYYYERIATRIIKDNQNSQIHRFHFANSKQDGDRYYRYGTQHQSNKTCLVPQNIMDDFKPNTECHSAQLLIYKPRVNQ
jgi:hypothetical protein